MRKLLLSKLVFDNVEDAGFDVEVFLEWYHVLGELVLDRKDLTEAVDEASAKVLEAEMELIINNWNNLRSESERFNKPGKVG